MQRVTSGHDESESAAVGAEKYGRPKSACRAARRAAVAAGVGGRLPRAVSERVFLKVPQPLIDMTAVRFQSLQRSYACGGETVRPG